MTTDKDREIARLTKELADTKQKLEALLAADISRQQREHEQNLAIIELELAREKRLEAEQKAKRHR